MTMVDVEEGVGCRGLDLEIDDPITCAIDGKPISEIGVCPIDRHRRGEKVANLDRYQMY